MKVAYDPFLEYWSENRDHIRPVKNNRLPETWRF